MVMMEIRSLMSSCFCVSPKLERTLAPLEPLCGIAHAQIEIRKRHLRGSFEHAVPRSRRRVECLIEVMRGGLDVMPRGERSPDLQQRSCFCLSITCDSP